jgi:hypothetical protein
MRQLRIQFVGFPAAGRGCGISPLAWAEKGGPSPSYFSLRKEEDPWNV